MILQEHIFGAFRVIVSNKLRSGLSMLGIIIGVSSIVVMLAFGQGTTDQITERFNSMGANLISVSPGGSNASNVRGAGGAGGSASRIMTDELVAYIAQIPGVKNVSPIANASKQLVYKTYNTRASLVGVRSLYVRLKNLTLQSGMFISDEDVANGAQVVVLGNTLATNAFGGEDPLGKEIKLENGIFTVIGVLADNSQANSRAFLPITTVMSKLSGAFYYSSLDVEVEDVSQVEQMKTFLEQELLTYFKISSLDEANFSVSTLSEVLSSIQDVTKMMTLFLGGVAAISLLVGGIGVMNIMLVSVTERTREIGIRKAIGAYKRDILLQFLVESLILTLLAGTIGVGLSFGVVALINIFMRAIISWTAIAIAFASVTSIGVIFGILPANKAANLKPIDALRFE